MSPLRKEEEKYMIMVYPKGVPKAQRRELSMAFNAGALSVLNLVQAIAHTSTEEQGCKALDHLMQEIQSRCAELSELPKANPNN